MTVNKHTPGPWKVSRDYYIDAFVPESQDKDCGYHTIAKACGGPDKMRKANAALISAAPDMYEVLEDLYKYKGVMSDESTERARAVIAKARGE